MGFNSGFKGLKHTNGPRLHYKAFSKSESGVATRGTRRVKCFLFPLNVVAHGFM